jgi:type III secretion protein C
LTSPTAASSFAAPAASEVSPAAQESAQGTATLPGATATPAALSDAANAPSGGSSSGAQAEPILDNTAVEPKTMYINFNNISIVEYLRFISRNINKNFIFDENDLQFNVTIVSEEPTTFDNIMTALLQELRIHDLSLLEQGNNLIIHKNPKVNAVSQLVTDETAGRPASEIITQVFKLNTAIPDNVAAIIKPLTSENALVEVLAATNHLIITDLRSNVGQIAKLIRSVDSPQSGLVIGPYVVQNAPIDVLIEMARTIVAPIAQGQPLTIVPWESSNSIFIVSNPYIVERTISVLQHVDQYEKSTRIYDPRDMRYQEGIQGELPPSGAFLYNEPFELSPEEAVHLKQGEQPSELRGSHGNWERSPEGVWRLPLPGKEGAPGAPPPGRWHLDKNGKWVFDATPEGQENLGLPSIPGQPYEGAQGPHGGRQGQLLPGMHPQGQQPKGHWVLQPSGNWAFQLDEGEEMNVSRIMRPVQESAIIPLGARKQSHFYIYNLRFRKGAAIQQSLIAIADSLQRTDYPDMPLVSTLMSAQWVGSSNSMIFTGNDEHLEKMRALMVQLDTPLRQVYIEMLILETTIDDSLQFGVNWETRFGGAGSNWAGAQGFHSVALENINSLNSAMNQTGGVVNGLPNVPATIMTSTGFNFGVIGQTIVNKALGVEFSSIGAIVQALRLKTNTDIVLNPKIITEDSVPAEIFVGENIAFRTQSIASGDINNVITSNFEYRDVGTRLRVTPIIGEDNLVTLEISQELSRIIPSRLNTAQDSPGPDTSKSTTTTRVHLPDGYFLIISGMIRDERQRVVSKVPCLGGIPLLGAAFKDKSNIDTKRNQMIFLRPQIIDTEEKLQNLTKHQQDVWRYKRDNKKDWVYETEEAFEWMNLRRSPNYETNPAFENAFE